MAIGYALFAESRYVGKYLNTTGMPSNPRNNNRLAAPSLPEMPQTAEGATVEKHTYGQILKSSALIGGSSVLSIAIRIVQTKAMAVLWVQPGLACWACMGRLPTWR